MKKDTANELLNLSRDEYDKYASEFSQTRQNFWNELAFFKKYASSGDKVLDVGCGNGRLSEVFKDVDIEYTGIDFSKELIAIAKKERGAQGTFVHGNALSLPFEDNSFDTVFSIAVLHHIPSHENREQFVRELSRVLKQNGTCVLTAWNTLQWRFAKAHIAHIFKKIFKDSGLDFGDIILTFGKDKRKRFVHSLTKHSIRSLFEKNNFSCIVLKEVKRKSGYSNFVVTSNKLTNIKEGL